MKKSIPLRESSPANGPTWVLLGATGVIQPLAEAFLYRSPAARRALTSRVRPAEPESKRGRR